MNPVASYLRHKSSTLQSAHGSTALPRPFPVLASVGPDVDSCDQMNLRISFPGTLSLVKMGLGLDVREHTHSLFFPQGGT